MKHEEVVAALQKIADKGVAGDISKDDLQELKSYTLIDFTEPDSKSKKQGVILTKKGRVMLKSNSKPKA